MTNLNDFKSTNIIYVHELSEELQQTLAKENDLDLSLLNLLIFGQDETGKQTCFILKNCIPASNECQTKEISFHAYSEKRNPPNLVSSWIDKFKE